PPVRSFRLSAYHFFPALSRPSRGLPLLDKPARVLKEEVALAPADQAAVAQPRAARLEACGAPHVHHAIHRKAPPVLPDHAQRAHAAALVKARFHRHIPLHEPPSSTVFRHPTGWIVCSSRGFM